MNVLVRALPLINVQLKIVDTGHEGTNIFSTDGIAPTQKALGGGQGAKTGLYAVGSFGKKDGFVEKEESPTISSTYYKGVQHNQGEPAVAIPNSKEGMRIRRLTPVECERLMGLPDGWTSKGIIDGKEVDISDTQRYKMCGNGVVVNCVDYIYNLIIKSYE